ncbi:MAG: formate dehydrogenase subunit gamma [Phycisphaerae bacterium]
MSRGVAVWACLLRVAISPSPAIADDRDNCLFCHQYTGLAYPSESRDELRLLSVDAGYYEQALGPHARLACTDCHDADAARVIPHGKMPVVSCTQVCHLSSTTSTVKRFSHENVAAMLETSAHNSAALTDLHHTGGPLIRPDQSQCLFCHDEPVFRNVANLLPEIGNVVGRAMDRCDVCHLQQMPIDVAFAMQHVAARLLPARPSVEQAQVCAVCHSDPLFQEHYGAHDPVSSYLHSYHGKAALLGDKSTAGCVSCHVRDGANGHMMLAAADPNSSVHESNIADSCRSLACHPGADPAIAATAVHLELAAARGTAAHFLALCFVVLTTAAFTPWALVSVLELLHFVFGRKSDEVHRIEHLAQRIQQHPEGRAKLQRYTPLQRYQHWYLAFVFIALALTGLPLKFADQAWSRFVVDGLGGVAIAGNIHHWLGVALLVGLAAHAAYVVWGIRQRMRRARRDGNPISLWQALNQLPLWLTWDDAKNLWWLVRYSLFLEKVPPPFERFSLKEKFGYLAVFWGSVLLGVTGIILWSEQLASRLLGGEGLTLAAIAHADEAFLAVSYIGILHLSDVLLSPHAVPLSMATLTGRTPAGVLAAWHRGMVERIARELGIEQAEAPQ